MIFSKLVCRFYPVLISIIFFSCSQNSTELPPEKPNDLKIEYRVDGGMSDYKVNIIIKNDTCYYFKKENGKAVNKTFTLMNEESSAIYSLLKKNNFDRISFNKANGTVYDRGGITIKVLWDKKSITVSDAQSNFVTEEWYEKWRAITEGIDEIISKKAK